MEKTLDQERCREILVSLRKITQAIDIHSRMLNKKFGLTGPQLILLQEIANHGHISVTPLSKLTSLSQATITDITKRLMAKGYILREKREDDRRAVRLSLTPDGHRVLENLPPLLQEQFTQRFSRLENWEQMMILAAFERVVQMMSAEEIEASPVLVTGPIRNNEAAKPKK
ncbi:MAG: MarR family transcriptional regulator [Desulfobacterales bacterium]|nr:MarR family transcriptional regulator [Desulfobacterales bacterium]